MKVTSILILQIVLVLLFTSCSLNGKQQYEELCKVDSLLENNCIDSAQLILNQIQKDKILAENTKAYYNLLFTKLLYMQYRTYIPLIPIDQSISCYENEGNTSKLSQALFYKGAILYYMGKHKEGILLVKRSEKLANSLQDQDLKCKIFDLLAIINSDIGEYKTALFYVQKCMKIIEKKKATPFQQVDMCNRLAVVYSDLALKDSAKYYMNKCIPLLSYVPSSAKVIFYDNIGYFNMDSNSEMSLKYLKEAMRIGPSPDTYDNLARLYMKRGEKHRADSLWEKALQTKDILKKSKIVEAMLNFKKQEGDLKEIANLATLLVALKDSVSAQRQDEQLKETQVNFDYQAEQAKYEKDKQRLIFTVFILVLVLIIIVLFSFLLQVKNRKSRIEKEKDSLEKMRLLQSYKNMILQLEQEGKTDKNEIEKLKWKIEKLQSTLNNKSNMGCLLYHYAKEGKNIREWNKTELVEFLNYYISVDINFSLTLDENEELTARQKVFLVLKHEGKSENEIAEMMGLSNTAFRTMKSRIYKTWKEN